MAKDIIMLTTPVFRVAFPSVFAATSFDGSAEKYSLTAIWTPAGFKGNEPALWKKLGAELQRVSMEGLKKNWKDLNPDKRGLRNGKEKELEGFGEGTMFASLSTQKKPPVYGLDKLPITDPEEIYPGCYCRAVVNVYHYDNKSKGTAIGLRSLQKIKDGPRLDGGGGGSINEFDGDVDDSWMEAHTDSLLDNPDDGLGLL